MAAAALVLSLSCRGIYPCLCLDAESREQYKGAVGLARERGCTNRA